MPLAAPPARWEAEAVLFVISGVVLFFILPSPWNVVALFGGVIAGLVEMFVWWLVLRKKVVRSGVETMIGERGRVVEACRPVGKVALLGELWQARCEQGAGEGETVRVVARDQLLLIVEPDPGDASPA